MTPEARKIQDELKARGVDLADRFGFFEAAGQVVRREVSSTWEKCIQILEGRAAELEPLKGKPGIVVWKHGFLLGLAERLRKEEAADKAKGEVRSR